MQKGDTGNEVINWQLFLQKNNYYKGNVDGDFGNLTHSATILFQMAHKLTADGVVGPKTISQAKKLGFMVAQTKTNNDYFPAEPNFGFLKRQEVENIFGKIEFEPDKNSTDKDKIKITNNFEKDNIETIFVPQLSKATNGKYTKMRIHKKIKYQLLKFFEEIEENDLLHLVLTYGGAYYPRFIRGSIYAISNHSYGTAFDINVEWNGLGKDPAKVGEKGSLLELVPIAQKWGFYWGGHFDRKDGMHFEVAKIINETQITNNQ